MLTPISATSSTCSTISLGEIGTFDVISRVGIIPVGVKLSMNFSGTRFSFLSA
jgi:hypothetical protein